MKKAILVLILVFMSGCTTRYTKKQEENRKFRKWGLQEIRIRFNSAGSSLVGNTMFLKNLGDVSIFLHEYGHVLHDFHLVPHDKLVRLLQVEYPIPPKIIPTNENTELQDFITTSTRWKVKYPHSHKEGDTLIEKELMANLFVIFTLQGINKEYIKNNYRELYVEYEKYYNNLSK
ncbi:MAG: hypothetical protein ACRDDY_03825 [Clostridium sp.]|uniref:hypothetical protein n=1 Tax=Clostridium sp. TaxID=1506 RepID=UPI003EE6BF74